MLEDDQEWPLEAHKSNLSQWCRILAWSRMHLIFRLKAMKRMTRSAEKKAKKTCSATWNWTCARSNESATTLLAMVGFDVGTPLN